MTHIHTVDGGWSQWSEWSECSVTCGYSAGVRTRQKKCISPEPHCGGLDCIGEDMEMEQCIPCTDCPGKYSIQFVTRSSACSVATCK